MNLLVAHGRSADQYLVEASQKMGHTVHFMCNLQEMERLDDVRLTVKPDVWIAVPTRYDLRLSHAEYLDWYHFFIVSYVQDSEIHAILPSSSMDIILEQVAEVNEIFDMPGIRPPRARLFRDKAEYLPLLAMAGVPTPKIHEIVEPGDEARSISDYTFPVVAKPGLGCGGYGIFVASDAERLRWFFAPSDNPQGFSERALFYQDRDFAGQPKSYLHFGMGGRYVVQEYLEGPCISLAGTVTGGVLELNLAYDIGVTPPPHCSEINFSWPSAHDIERACSNIISNLTEALTWPDGAWMADTIFHNGELHVVDLAPRTSSSGTKMLYHTCGNLSYAWNVVSSLLHGTKDFKIEPKTETFYSFIPFPKGKIRNIRYPDSSNLTEREIPSGDEIRVFEMRNDVQVADRGWVVAQGDNAEERVQHFIAGIGYDKE